MDDSLIVPDSMVSLKAPLLYSTMMEEGDCAINSDSDVGSIEPYQQGYHPIDVPQSAWIF